MEIWVVDWVSLTYLSYLKWGWDLSLSHWPQRDLQQRVGRHVAKFLAFQLRSGGSSYHVCPVSRYIICGFDPISEAMNGFEGPVCVALLLVNTQEINTWVPQIVRTSTNTLFYVPGLPI
jgi:hypothetical protein